MKRKLLSYIWSSFDTEIIHRHTYFTCLSMDLTFRIVEYLKLKSKVLQMVKELYNRIATNFSMGRPYILYRSRNLKCSPNTVTIVYDDIS